MNRAPIPQGGRHAAAPMRAGATGVLCLLAAMGALCLFAIPGAGPAAIAQTRTDLYITTIAMDSLDATFFLPVTVAPPSGYPSILFVHGFGGSKNDDTANGRIYAAAGYITLCYSVRGHGLSTGLSTIMAGQERADLATVVAFMKTLPGIDTTKMSVSGGSQGGLHGLWAIADDLGMAAVSSDVIVPAWAGDMLMNGSVRRTLVNLLKNGVVRYDPVRDTLWDFVRADDYDALAAAFPPGRDLDTAELNSRTVPSLRFLKWQDHYFTAENGIEAFRRYAGAKKIYLGTRGHFSDQVESERIYHYDQVTRWLGHWLKGDNNGIDAESVYTYAESSLPMDTAGFFHWTRDGTSLWPPPGAQPFRFYLSADSTLSLDGPAASGASLTLVNDHADTNYTFDDAYLQGFTGAAFDAALPRHALAYESVPLPWDVEWLGTPRMRLHVTPADSAFPIHAQIYEVDTAGVKYFVNRIDYTERHWAGGEGTIDAAGAAHAHRFRAGSRVRLELTNIDVTNRDLLGEYPFVLPMFADASVTVHADPLRPSYLELPLMQSPLGVGVAGTPPAAGPGLRQNYPNPFNASTMIAADIPIAGTPTVTVHNLLGEAVATLTGAEGVAGRRTFSWNAAGLPTGVYFARLSVATPGRGVERVGGAIKLLLVR